MAIRPLVGEILCSHWMEKTSGLAFSLPRLEPEYLLLLVMSSCIFCVWSGVVLRIQKKITLSLLAKPPRSLPAVHDDSVWLFGRVIIMNSLESGLCLVVCVAHLSHALFLLITRGHKCFFLNITTDLNG